MKIEFDYRFDTNGFFNTPEKRAALEYAGNVWSNTLKDDFEAIPAGAKFTTTNPTTGQSEIIVLDREIDDLVIFVGGGSLENGNNNSTANLRTNDYHLKVCACTACTNTSTNTSNQVVNLSQPGILDTENIINTDSLLAQAQINGTDLQGDIFQRRVARDFRGTGTGTDFEPWAGTISFNPSNTINWNFDLENTNNSTIDFISVALHEIGHILGIGVAPIFDLLGEGGTFKGVNALAANNGAAIPLESDLSHVAEGFSGNSVLLDPLLNENRNLPSNFDLAILADLGYEIAGFTKQGFLPEIATDESEEISGSSINDVINGLAGNDQIHGNDGDDTLNGGVGNDSLFGTVGNDSLFGDLGVDSLHGGVGKDTLDGGADNDFLIGAEDNDLILGGDGDDELQGNMGADVLQGGIGNDSLFGQEDADFLLGNEGNDRLQGDVGNDSLQGNEGNDTIFGEAGNDIIDGGLGDDALVGEAGSDRFFFGTNNGNDTINDFIVSEDIIEIAANLGFSNGNQVLAAITNTGAVTNSDDLFSEVTLSDGNTIRIFHDTNLTANNFRVVTESSIGSSVFNVIDVVSNSSGFTIKFDESLNTEVLDLSDLTLVQNSTGAEVAGSLIWNQNNFTLSFIKSDGILESDRYNLTLVSDENSLISATDKLLDGNNDGIAGGNFVTEFTINNDEQRALTVEDVTASSGANTAFDIALDNGADVTKVEFTVTYNPNLLDISDVVINSQLADDWTITTEDLTNPGIATITLEGTTALNSQAIDLVQLQATIPDTASYGVSDLITIQEPSLNDRNLTAIGDNGLQTVALTGDANGDGSYSNLDSYLISQMAVGLFDSFNAFPTTDAQLIADLNQDGIISALDSFLVAQEIN
jgi:Ca2+-binding RTX toxin-like protein